MLIHHIPQEQDKQKAANSDNPLSIFIENKQKKLIKMIDLEMNFSPVSLPPSKQSLIQNNFHPEAYRLKTEACSNVQ